MIDKNIPVNIPCPSCQHLKKVTISEFEDNPFFTCEGCGSEVELESSDFYKDLDNARDKVINSIRDSLKEFTR